MTILSIVLNNKTFVEKYHFNQEILTFLEDNTESRTYYVTNVQFFLCRPFIYSCTARVRFDYVTCYTSLQEFYISLCWEFCLCDRLCFVNVDLKCVLSELKLLTVILWFTNLYSSSAMKQYLR